jgi:hypothetical protein
VDKPLHILPLVFLPLHIPPGDAHYVAQTTTRPIPGDVTLLEIMPHMHLLGRTMTVTAGMPGGVTRPLIDVPDWDFNWQTTYVYRRPVSLPRGTVLHLTATYDNSAANPRNPNVPPKLVTWGEQTTDEMCIAFLFYTVDSEHLTQGAVDHTVDWTQGPRKQLLGHFLGLFDTNGDGILEPGERAAMNQFIQDQERKRLLLSHNDIGGVAEGRSPAPHL